MEALEAKIKEAELFRDTFFVNNPGRTSADRIRIVREKILPLIQDIPLDVNGHSQSASSAEYNYLCGRILNICPEYDANCERYLLRAVKLEPSHADALRELGECAWKKRSYSYAIDCFRKSLSYKRTAGCLSALSLSLRQFAFNEANPETKNELLEESALLCSEAVQVDPMDANSWHILGNTYLLDFFRGNQTDTGLMDKARDSYERALGLGANLHIGELHLNYATALKFCQCYKECLKHMKLAVVYAPEFGDIKEQLQALTSFLKQISTNVLKKGKMSAKKMRQFQSTLGESDLGEYSKKKQTTKNGKSAVLEPVAFARLKEGVNHGAVICGKVLAVIPNSDSVPYTFVACDLEGTCYAFCVYNVAQKFGVVVGNSVAVPEPCVIDVKVQLEGDKKSEQLDFRIIRVANPLEMLRNGKKFSWDCMAYCEMCANTMT